MEFPVSGKRVLLAAGSNRQKRPKCIGRAKSPRSCLSEEHKALNLFPLDRIAASGFPTDIACDRSLGRHAAP